MRRPGELGELSELTGVLFSPTATDVERRKNPVCHFVTPLDGNTDLDVHRPEVKIN